MNQDLPTGGFRSLTGGFWAPVVTRKHLLEGPGIVQFNASHEVWPLWHVWPGFQGSFMPGEPFGTLFFTSDKDVEYNDFG